MNMMDVLADAKSPVSADVYGKLFRILADEITDASVFGNLSIKYLKVHTKCNAAYLLLANE